MCFQRFNGLSPTSMKKVLTLALTAASIAIAAAYAEDAPKHIDVSTFPPASKIIDDVVVPVPSEVFAVLDKLGKPHWEDVLRSSKSFSKPEKPPRGDA